MICQISASVMPTPCPFVPFAGIAVPAIPLLMTWNISASECVCFLCARVRSGPRPPPRAPSPWQSAQLIRNSYSPGLRRLGVAREGIAVVDALRHRRQETQIRPLLQIGVPTWMTFLGKWPHSTPCLSDSSFGNLGLRTVRSDSLRRTCPGGICRLHFWLSTLKSSLRCADS